MLLYKADSQKYEDTKADTGTVPFEKVLICAWYKKRIPLRYEYDLFKYKNVLFEQGPASGIAFGPLFLKVYLENVVVKIEYYSVINCTCGYFFLNNNIIHLKTSLKKI